MYYTPWQLEVAAHRISKGLPIDHELAVAALESAQSNSDREFVEIALQLNMRTDELHTAQDELRSAWKRAADAESLKAHLDRIRSAVNDDRPAVINSTSGVAGAP